ncbi:hypothetical protein A3D11_01835 [Candidatus Peribacteria bacterium RIFCSPHIGHO2_02_FULL_49_16]|nr:MAG: hypothetical protein A2880_00945 [Candidatus Peribacteria bacterium RIFCSPHIGHO2_01_FULL_49_38]OGJ58657.1 MAG: hypothetical protein A3D11_01835 [Candidatus Peribacteria bacterium RIFCSPHIGHO2_02_FULL_49_16]
MHVAIIADWLTAMGGAERVLKELCALWPDAVLFSTVADRHILHQFPVKRNQTSFLQPWYRVFKKHQPLLFSMPRAVEEFDLRDFDLIISSSHAVAKGVIPPPHALHICYCHTPIRYAWEMEDQYLDDFHIPHVFRPAIKRRLMQFRRWDMTSAKRVDHFIANSSITQERIKRIYARESVVIHPPVHNRFFAEARRPPGNLFSTIYYLAVGRLVPYKRFDLLIKLANQKKMMLIIAGDGQDRKRLQKMAGPTVQFLGRVSDAELSALYANAKALLFPAHEDAGIVPLEAQACGTPVIAYGKGGIRDAVQENVTGVFFEEQTVESMRGALDHFEKQSWNRKNIRAHAKQFSQDQFRTNMRMHVHAYIHASRH